MVRIFRSIKTERMHKVGYENFKNAEYSKSDYIDGYCHNVWPLHYNVGLAPSESEIRYQVSKIVAKIS